MVGYDYVLESRRSAARLQSRTVAQRLPRKSYAYFLYSVTEKPARRFQATPYELIFVVFVITLAIEVWEDQPFGFCRDITQIVGG